MSESHSSDGALGRAIELAQQGQPQAAEAICREVLEKSPGDGEAWNFLGMILLGRGALADAEQAFRRATELDGHVADYWHNLSVACRSLGQAAEAEPQARRATDIDSARPAFWQNLGQILYGQQRWNAAADAFREAVRLSPDDGATWGNLGAAEQCCDRLAEAQAAYERALQLAPADGIALTNYALILTKRGDAKRAQQLAQSVLASNPQFALAWFVLGTASQALGDLASAEIAYRNTLTLDPRHTGARSNLVLALQRRNRLAEAEQLARQLVAENPQLAEGWARLAVSLRLRGEVDEAVKCWRHSLNLQSSAEIHSQLLHVLQYLEDVKPADLLAAHQQWNSLYAQPLQGLSPTAHSDSRSRLRIGLVSEDFGQHPVTFLSLGAIESLDRDACEIVCYSDRAQVDRWTDRFRAAATTWRETAGLTDEELADQIRRDEIAVLIDLMGHAGKRLLTFARRPAPFQATWLGYVGTTGLTAMDAIIADRFHVQPGEEHYYVEKVLRLPHGYACYTSPADAPPVSPLPASTSGFMTFGCFNSPVKYSSGTFGAWAHLLRSLPEARLLLKATGLDAPEIVARVRSEFTRRGVSGERILIEGHSEHCELLASYNRIDLALDTQPYSSGVTTCEALWMGVPVITFPGQTFAGRHATSHMTNAGFGQFVAENLDGYVELAIQWANRLDELSELRAKMREQVRCSPLCDAQTFARDFLRLLMSVRR